MNIVWIGAALTTGLVGSLHCVGMCGPLAMALPVGRLPVAQRGLGLGVYHLARITAYAGLGVVIGSAGQGLLLIGLQRPLSIGAGLFLLIWTLLLQSRLTGLIGRLSTCWIVRPMARFLQAPSVKSFFMLGFLNGLMPCGFVYVALAGAVVTGTAMTSAAYMILFGLGTIPALLAIRKMPELFPIRVRQRFVRLMPLMAVGLGILLMARGLYQPPQSGHGDQLIPLCYGTTWVK